jgi:hypothetical protein
MKMEAVCSQGTLIFACSQVGTTQKRKIDVFNAVRTSGLGVSVSEILQANFTILLKKWIY